MTFDLATYLDDMVVTQDDPDLKLAIDSVELTELACDDAWLARQEHYGVAGAMERQLEYLGGTLVPNAESRIQRMSSKGVMGESYTMDSWFGTSNEDDQHVNDEIALDQLIDDQQTFVDGLHRRMRVAAIRFVTRVRAHDDLSKTLEQLTYGGIKAKAETNRQAAAARGVKVA